ncbi:hypothetical protein Q5H91_11240 [Sphingomonas sp. KR1UV-12]|uniref:PhiE125 gp8 family phage protein n=1 Tax=Sphingomonas aurea TaxID=3063994 RepID=A0ABT9ELE9_9SPHN|nr:hypothetical protein [Sphingomonas sp. KR1UV-12]MDP1027790.1 hypothetical protein [Sphingomonas sp. KR1UV-12]
MTEGAVVAAAVAAAKGLLRLEGTAEDAVLTRLVNGAIEAGEVYCGVRFTERTVEAALTGTGDWQALAERPVVAITGVAATGGGALAVDAHAVDIEGGLGRVRVPAGMQVLVTYRAGLAPRWTAMPAGVAHGVVLLAVHWFENRGADAMPPAAVVALWRPYRRLRIGR